MSESMGDTSASSAPEKPERKEVVLTLTTARNMLPLMRMIVGDYLAAQQSIDRMEPEHDRLVRHRTDLSWPERSRRYYLQDELVVQENNVKAALGEMEELGIALLDPDLGRIGFPTIVNGRKAYFTWRPSENALRYWQYLGEATLRPIPASWDKAVENSLSGKS
jgi:hypothetical protein